MPDCKWTCPICNVPVNTSAQLYVDRLDMVLILHTLCMALETLQMLNADIVVHLDLFAKKSLNINFHLSRLTGAQMAYI